MEPKLIIHTAKQLEEVGRVFVFRKLDVSVFVFADSMPNWDLPMAREAIAT